MPFARRCRPLIFACVAAIAAACGEPPEKEMQQAQVAIDTARAAGADRYAPAEYAAAVDTLKLAYDAAEARDYRLALHHALESRDRAQAAAAAASDGKAQARSDAERALAGFTAAIEKLHAELKAAESKKTRAKALGAARKAVADAEARLQEARTALQQEDYQGASSLIEGATPAVAAASGDLAAAVPPPPRRRR